MLAIDQLLGEPGDLGLARENAGDLLRQCRECGEEAAAIGGRQIADAAQVDGQQREGDGRAGESLGRHDGDFGTGMQVDAASAFSRDRAADDVDDAEHAPALALDFLHRRQGVEGLARLADGDIERVALDDRVAVAEFGGRLGMRRQPGQLLDQMGADEAGDVSRAATEDLDPADVEELVRGELDAAQMRRLKARLEPPAQRTRDRLGLFGDLLPHKMLEFALVEGLARPGDRRRDLRGRPTVEGRGLKPVGAHQGDLAVVEIDDTSGMPHQGRGVGSDEHLALADPQHDRAAVARDDDRVGARCVEHGKPPGAGDQPQCRAHRFVEGMLRHRRDQMRQHLAVGLGAEGDAGALEPRAQCRGILDDAVVDDRDAVRPVAMRVGVLVARLAMRRPARMGDAGRTLEAGRQQLFELAHPSFAFGQAQLACVGDRDPGRIVAAIFEPVQPLHQDRRCVAFADIADDAAHPQSPQP